MSTKGSKKVSVLQPGVWIWDDISCSLVYRSSAVAESGRTAEARLQAATRADLSLGQSLLEEADEGARAGRRRKSLGAGAGPTLRLPTCLQTSFQAEIDVVDQMHFRRTYQRRTTTGWPDVVLLRDVKDVVLFTAAPPPPPELVWLIHTKTADRFLRGLILYFRIYLQAYAELRSKRVALAKKLALPVVGAVERMRQDLSDARALAARDYSCLMLCAAQRWLKEGLTPREIDSRDLRLMEPLIRVSARMVWVCLGRRSLNLIEREAGRLFRSDAFNLNERRAKVRFQPTPVDDPAPDICKLVVCSPLVRELLAPRDDFRTLSVGVVDMRPKDARLVTLEKLLLCPEEELDGRLGLLGKPREEMDTMLRPAFGTKTAVDGRGSNVSWFTMDGRNDSQILPAKRRSMQRMITRQSNST